jgi:hypothetical protein
VTFFLLSPLRKFTKILDNLCPFRYLAFHICVHLAFEKVFVRIDGDNIRKRPVSKEKNLCTPWIKRGEEFMMLWIMRGEGLLQWSWLVAKESGSAL